MIATQNNLIAKEAEPTTTEKAETVKIENKNEKFESPKLEKLSKTLGISEIIATISEIMIDHNSNPGNHSIRRDNQKTKFKKH